jgi:hypothetical protein
MHAHTTRETSTGHTKYPHACPPITHLVYIESFFSQVHDEREWGCWRKKWTKMDVGGGKLVGLVDLQIGEASPHKTMEQGRFINQEWRQEWRN